MRAIEKRDTERKIAVSLPELATMLGCGRYTASKIGEDAHARIYIGKRVLYSVEKIEEYCRKISI